MVSEKRGLIIAGMHRSYTSVLAHSLQNAGLFLGPDLVEPSPSNIYGHFEDRSLIRFHMKHMKSMGFNDFGFPLNWRKPVPFLADPEKFKEGRELISRIYPNSVYAWKDPRTVFFLDFWLQVLPQSHFVFVTRHPGQCVRSLLKRRFGRKPSIKKIPFAWRCLNFWKLTNQLILKFALEHPSRCIILQTPDLFIKLEEGDRFQRWLDQTNTCDLKSLDFVKVFDHELANKQALPRFLERMVNGRADVLKTYVDLIKLSQD